MTREVGGGVPGAGVETIRTPQTQTTPRRHGTNWALIGQYGALKRGVDTRPSADLQRPLLATIVERFLKVS